MNDNKLAPILVSVYNRFDSLVRCVDSLKKNDLAKYSDIYIISDAPSCAKDQEPVRKIREYILSIEGFKSVCPIFNDRNLGSGGSSVKLIKTALLKNDRFIRLEDDIVVSSDFLTYLNEGLRFYENNKSVYGVCAFSLPFKLPEGYDKDVYFYNSNSPWGYASWKDRYEAVNLDYFDRYSELKKDRRKYREFMSIGFYIKGILQADSRKEIVAGDLRVYYHMFQHGMCSVFPVVSKTQNWGFDGTGEHCGNKKVWWAKPELDTRNRPTEFVPFMGYDKELLRNHRRFQDKINGGIIAKYLKYTWVHRLWKKLKKHL